MVTVTFPSRPQAAPLAEAPARAAPEPGSQQFREVFDLLASDDAASAAPQLKDAPPSPDKTDDPIEPSSDEEEHALPQDRRAEPSDRTDIAGGQAAPLARPVAEGVIIGEALPDREEKSALSGPIRLLDPLASGVPVLQALMILTAASVDSGGDPIVQPLGDTAGPAFAIPLPQGAAPVPAAVIAQPTDPASAALPLPGESSSPAPVPTDKAIQEPGLFIPAEPAEIRERKPGPATGMPPFWAAREAADTDAAAPDGPSPEQHDGLSGDLAAPKPAAQPRIDRAAAQPEVEAAISIAGDEPLAPREAKPGSAPLQVLLGGPSQAAPAPANLQAPGPATLPPQVPAQIAAALAARPERPLEVRMAPAELGGLTVNLRQDGEILRVVVQADRPETLDLLRRNGETLLEELRLAGFSGAALTFGDGGGAQDRGSSAPSRTTPVTDLPPTSAGVTAVTFGPAQTAQGLDLRL